MAEPTRQQLANNQAALMEVVLAILEAVSGERTGVLVERDGGGDLLVAPSPGRLEVIEELDR